MSKTKDVLELLSKGYMPYKGIVPESFYRERQCRDSRKADWFARPRSKEHLHSRYVCLGCRKVCAAVDPEGFQLLLPLRPTRPGQILIGVAEQLTVDQLLKSRRVLRVDEAAFALAVSRQIVHQLVEEGELDPVPGTPLRVTVESVCRRLEPAAQL